MRWRRWLSTQACIHMFSRQSMTPAVEFRSVLTYDPASADLHLVSVLQRLRWCQISSGTTFIFVLIKLYLTEIIINRQRKPIVSISVGMFLMQFAWFSHSDVTD